MAYFLSGETPERRNMDKEILAEYLHCHHYGSEYAVISKTLERKFAISGKTLRDLVNALRCEGIPIASNQNGYFYARTKTELRATIKHMRCRIAGIKAAISGLNYALAVLNDSQTQLPMEGDDEN